MGAAAHRPTVAPGGLFEVRLLVNRAAPLEGCSALHTRHGGGQVGFAAGGERAPSELRKPHIVISLPEGLLKVATAAARF